jgi:hypothetical protein
MKKINYFIIFYLAAVIFSKLFLPFYPYTLMSSSLEGSTAKFKIYSMPFIHEILVFISYSWIFSIPIIGLFVVLFSVYNKNKNITQDVNINTNVNNARGNYLKYFLLLVPVFLWVLAYLSSFIFNCKGGSGCTLVLGFFFLPLLYVVGPLSFLLGLYFYFTENK